MFAHPSPYVSVMFVLKQEKRDIHMLLEAEGYTYDLIPMEEGLFYLNLYPAGSTAEH